MEFETKYKGKEIKIHPLDLQKLEEKISRGGLTSLENEINFLLGLSDIPVVSDQNVAQGKMLIIDWDKMRKFGFGFGFHLRSHVFEKGGGI